MKSEGVQKNLKPKIDRDLFYQNQSIGDLDVFTLIEWQGNIFCWNVDLDYFQRWSCIYRHQRRRQTKDTSSIFRLRNPNTITGAYFVLTD